MIEILKYLIEGFAVAVAAHLVAKGKLQLKEVIMLGITAGLVFLVLDIYSPSVAVSARQGAGFGIGWQLVGGDAEQMETLQTQETQETQEFGGLPYKLVDGEYSAKVLLAGYDELVEPHNSNIAHAQWPWSLDTQMGGAAGSEETIGSGMGMPTMETASAMPAMPAIQTMASMTNVPAMPMAETSAPEAPTMEYVSEQVTALSTPVAMSGSEEVLQDKNHRVAGVLYSGDLVDVMADGAYMQRGAVDSQVIFSTPLPKIGTNLSKVRLVHPKHKADKQMQLKYGDPVYLMHNTYFNNSNLNRFIKYGDRLQSHQTGPLFRTFKIFDANNKSNTGPVVSGAPILLARGDEDGETIFLKVEGDKSVSSKNPASTASRFTVNLKRVFEIGNRNLCVCPNEILYP